MTAIKKLNDNALKGLQQLAETNEYKILLGTLELLIRDHYEMLLAPQGAESDLARLNFIRGFNTSKEILNHLQEIIAAELDLREAKTEPGQQREFPHISNVVSFSKTPNNV